MSLTSLEADDDDDDELDDDEVEADGFATTPSAYDNNDLFDIGFGLSDEIGLNNFSEYSLV
jgi:hypothetical protein